jgi:hypothetical protein
MIEPYRITILAGHVLFVRVAVSVTTRKPWLPEGSYISAVRHTKVIVRTTIRTGRSVDTR